MFSNFFLAYSHIPHFHQKNCSDFAPSALRLRMEESAVIFAAYDVWHGEDVRAPHIEALWLMFVMNSEAANEHFQQRR
mgnify:CR=1 FL=1